MKTEFYINDKIPEHKIIIDKINNRNRIKYSSINAYLLNAVAAFEEPQIIEEYIKKAVDTNTTLIRSIISEEIKKAIKETSMIDKNVTVSEYPDIDNDL